MNGSAVTTSQLPLLTPVQRLSSHIPCICCVIFYMPDALLALLRVAGMLHACTTFCLLLQFCAPPCWQQLHLTVYDYFQNTAVTTSNDMAKASATMVVPATFDVTRTSGVAHTARR